MILSSLFLSLVQDGAPASGAQGAPGTPGATGPAPSMFDSLLSMAPPLLLCFGVFYLIVLRPEQKQKKLRLSMLADMKKGDKVITNSGLYGSIVQIQDGVVTLQVADNVRMRYALSAIQSVLADEDKKEDTKSS
jgi:preprotein translocase subunit YajC